MKLNYIPEFVFLIIFIYVVYHNMDSFMENLLYLDVNLNLVENPVSPCGPNYSYVVITNNTFIPLSMEEWQLSDIYGPYSFPNRWIWPGQSINLWSGSGTDDQDNLYAGRSIPVWNRYEMTFEVSNLYGLTGFTSWQNWTCDPFW